MNKVAHKAFALPRGRAVSDGNDIHMIGKNQALHGALGVIQPHPGLGRINHGRIQYLAGFVYHGQFTAIDIAGIKAHNRLALDGRLHKQMFQIIGKKRNGPLAGAVKKIVPDLSFHAGRNQPFITVAQCGQNIFLGRAVLCFENQSGKIVEDQICRNGHAHFQKFFFFATVNGQHPVPRDFGHRFAVVVIRLINRRLFFGGFGRDHPVGHGKRAHPFTVIGVVGNIFRKNVHGPRESLLPRVHFFFRIHQRVGHFFQRGRIAFFLRHQCFGQRRQSPVARHRSAGLALGTERTVNIVDFGNGLGIVNGIGDLRREFFLRGDQVLDFFPARFDIAQILQPFFQFPQDGIIQRTGHFFAVAGNERNGISLVNKRHRLFHPILRDVQFFGKDLANGHKNLRFPAVTVR